MLTAEEGGVWKIDRADEAWSADLAEGIEISLPNRASSLGRKDQPFPWESR
jgi:hypothetical protein